MRNSNQYIYLSLASSYEVVKIDRGAITFRGWKKNREWTLEIIEGPLIVECRDEAESYYYEGSLEIKKLLSNLEPGNLYTKNIYSGIELFRIIRKSGDY